MSTITTFATDGSMTTFHSATLYIGEGVARITQADQETYIPMSGVLAIQQRPAPPTIPRPDSHRQKFWRSV